MVLDSNINTREFDKFCEVGGETAVRTCTTIESTTPLPTSDQPSEDPDTGSTDHFNSTVGLVATPVPAVAGGTITSILIECTKQNPSTTKLFVSFDGGVNFKSMFQGSSMTWSPRGGVTQIYLYGNQATTDYEIIMNRNP